MTEVPSQQPSSESEKKVPWLKRMFFDRDAVIIDLWWLPRMFEEGLLPRNGDLVLSIVIGGVVIYLLCTR